jgi:peptide/nickel transport system substrate-binding protein
VDIRLRRLRRAAFAGVALLAMTTACAPSAKSPSGGSGGSGTLIIGMTASDIPLLDTGMCQNEGYEGIRFVGNQMYDGLTKFDLKQGTEIPKIIPGLAKSWEPNAAGDVWTFHLRDGVKFHDGTPFDADAALFNLQRYTDKTSPAFYQELNAQAGLSVQGIKSVRKVDDMTVEISTKGPWSYLPVDLATVYFGSPTAIRKAGNKDFAAHPIGTGPFKFVSVVRGQQLVYEANKDYWGGAPKVDKIILRPIPDPTARTAALRAGEVNWIEVPPPDDVPSLSKDGYQVLTNSYDHIWPWVLDTSKKPWNDVRVRQAANWAIDRQSLVDKVLKGTAEPALQASPKANASYRAANDIYGYDVAKAKALLAEAGYPNGFTTTLSYPTSGSGNMIPGPMNEALQQNLAAVGIKVELKPVEWASMLTDFFVGKIPGGADAINISLSYQQEGFWSSWYGTGNALNTGKYSNPAVDALFTKAKSELDPAKRSDLYAEASVLITKDAPWLFVVDDKNPRALASNVKGFVEPKSWFADLTTVSVG